MSHEVETMAYAGAVPWHGLGKEVLPDLTPAQMLEAAELDWNVEKRDLFYFNDKNSEIRAGRKQALVRSSDDKLLDIVSDTWNPLQNQEAFEFFHDFVMAGNMEMHTAGSLKDGQIVWALAKIKDGFELTSGDKVEPYLLFSNPHKFGAAIDVRFTAIRVVCNNTLAMSLEGASSRFVKINHRQKFDADEVKQTLGVAMDKLDAYKQAAEILSSKKFDDDSLAEYFREVFPSMSYNKGAEDKTSRQAKMCHENLNDQPGAKFGAGTWWQAYNCITYITDHKLGRSADSRLTSAWFGQNRKKKIYALDKALEFAEAS